MTLRRGEVVYENGEILATPVRLGVNTGMVVTESVTQARLVTPPVAENFPPPCPA